MKVQAMHPDPCLEETFVITLLSATFAMQCTPAPGRYTGDFGGVYLHRGLSLMECLTPWLVVRAI